MYKKRIFLLGVLLVLLSAVNVSADTIIPGGNVSGTWTAAVGDTTIIPPGYVSGTWTAAGSPYLVQGQITVPADSSLIIEPGVEVIFYGNIRLYVYGTLQAIGTETDSIYFMPADTTSGWGNIEIQYSAADFSYCSVRYSGTGGGAAIRALGSSVNISHCLISDNKSTEGGGLGVHYGSHVTVSNSSILRNYSVIRGGGIGLRDSSYLAISNSSISYNQSSFYSDDRIGGGIHAYSSDSLIVTNCIFSNNIAGPLTGNYSKGGAIGMEPYGSGGYVHISGCTFLDNSADYEGGAIYLSNCTAILNDNFFQGNSSLYEGVALSVENCALEVSGNIFDHNTPLQPSQMLGAVWIGDNSNAVFEHCNFYNNGGAFTDRIFILSGSSSLSMKNTVFSHHPLAFAMFFHPGSIVSVEYCNFFNALGNFIGSVPAGLGTISGTNANGDPCDTFYNIFLDPLYVDPAVGDFHLQAFSPCIDAGDPASPKDPDSTISDIGAFYYHYLRGDNNADGDVTLSDIVYLINYLFKQGAEPKPMQAGDANCDGKVSLSDIVYLISYLFKSGPPPCI
jgi:predicted outer membrane repeat protein